MAGTRCMDRRCFLKAMGVAAAGGAALAGGDARAETAPSAAPSAKAGARPNLFFAIADDWGWPHSPLYGDPVVRTPTFERVAREGVLFPYTCVASPSCTPSRGSVLTGQMFYRLEEGGNLWSTLPAKFDVYPDLLEAAGYHVGSMRKGWGPGSVQAGGRTRQPAGPPHKTFGEFLKGVPEAKPFCFWFGSGDPHRPYEPGSGVASGMKLEDVRVPPHLPDVPEVRSDLCDYYFEVQRFDREVGEALALLEQAGTLDNTLVVVTGDNGFPFPRAKTNLYDYGVREPLAVRWPARCRGGRVVDDFISFTDFAPTFLEAAGLKVPEAMTGRSFLDLLTSDRQGRVDPKRDRIVTGRERHTDRSAGGVGYPMRALRTHEFLYIRNFKPDRWPAGDPEGYGDIDGGPTKAYMMAHRDDPKVAPLFPLSFGKRPAEELYDCRKDPGQLKNVADDPAYADVRKRLADDLTAYLTRTRDPRVLGTGDAFDTYPYRGGSDRPPARKAKTT